jgi:hypothetical protein
MEAEISLPYSQVPTTRPYFELDQLSSFLQNPLLEDLF